jgi:hypothetical protein
MTIRMMLLLVLAAACEGAPQPPAPAALSPAAVSAAPLGDPPPPAAEPDTQPDRSSPEALLRSVLSARNAADKTLAFLARAELLTAGKARLDKLDEARAHRHFRMPAVGPLWSRIEAAVAAGRYRIETHDALATATFEVGGAAGTLTLSFEKVAGQWYLGLGN